MPEQAEGSPNNYLPIPKEGSYLPKSRLRSSCLFSYPSVQLQPTESQLPSRQPPFLTRATHAFPGLLPQKPCGSTDQNTYECGYFVGFSLCSPGWPRTSSSPTSPNVLNPFFSATTSNQHLWHAPAWMTPQVGSLLS